MKEISRKELLTSGVVLATVGVSAFAIACRKKPAEEATTTTSAGSCGDVSGLTGPEKEMRTTLKYVDVSEVAGKACDGCALYVAAAAGSSCGTCQVVKGPIAPGGHCSSWVKKA